MKRGLACVGLVTLMLVALGASAATAQSASERSLARSLFRQGVDAARESRWEEARELFERAYELDPRPLTLVNYAGALVSVGRLVEGAEAYRSFLASAPEGRLRSDVERQLAEVEPRIPRMRVQVVGLAEGDAVRLDHWDISRAALEQPLPVDPGDHEVTVARGPDERSYPFSVAEGETRDLVIDLSGAPAPAVPAAALTPTPAETATDGGGDDVLESPIFWIIVGVVVAGGIAGGVAGGVVASQGTTPAHYGNLPPFQIALE